MAKFTTSRVCDATVNGYCIRDLGEPTPENTCDGTNPYDKNLTSSVRYADCSKNYWAGAKKACEAAKMKLPDKDVLSSLSRKTGAPTSDNYWSSTEDSASTAKHVDIRNGDVNANVKDDGDDKVLCVGE